MSEDIKRSQVLKTIMALNTKRGDSSWIQRGQDDEPEKPRTDAVKEVKPRPTRQNSYVLSAIKRFESADSSVNAPLPNMSLGNLARPANDGSPAKDAAQPEGPSVEATTDMVFQALADDLLKTLDTGPEKAAPTTNTIEENKHGYVARILSKYQHNKGGNEASVDKHDNVSTQNGGAESVFTLEKPEEEPPQEETSQMAAPQEETPQEGAPQAETSQMEAPKEETLQVEAPQVETPQVETPQEEDPQVEAPQEETSQMEAPKEETPQEQAPQEETSQMEAPKEKTLQVEAPQEEAPQEEAPEVGTSQMEAPKEETLQVEAPQLETPQVEAPQVETSQMEAPQVEPAQVEAPRVETPQVETPKEEDPQVEDPQEETSQMEAPKEETPQEDAPQVETPQVETPREDDPQVEAPQKDAAQEEAPQVEVIQVEALQEEAPQEEAPQVEVIQVEALQEEAPQVEAIQVEVPPNESPRVEDPQEKAHLEETQMEAPEKEPLIEEPTQEPTEQVDASEASTIESAITTAGETSVDQAEVKISTLPDVMLSTIQPPPSQVLDVVESLPEASIENTTVSGDAAGPQDNLETTLNTVIEAPPQFAAEEPLVELVAPTDGDIKTTPEVGSEGQPDEITVVEQSVESVPKNDEVVIEELNIYDALGGVPDSESGADQVKLPDADFKLNGGLEAESSTVDTVPEPVVDPEPLHTEESKVSGTDIANMTEILQKPQEELRTTSDGKAICYLCDQVIAGKTKLTLSEPLMTCHPECLKCGTCSKVLGDLLTPMFLHHQLILCDDCFAKALRA